jgi:hypothetical protein
MLNLAAIYHQRGPSTKAEELEELMGNMGIS